MTLRRAFAACLVLSAPGAFADELALPQGGQVVSGAVTETYNENTLDTLQHSDKAIVNYDSLNVGSGAQWRITQPGADSALLARTSQNDVSNIDGRVSANGNIMILNPNGVAFGPDAQVDVNGLVASTGSMSDEDFNAGRYRLDDVGANPNAAVTNAGTITLREGGFAALVAPRTSSREMARR